MLAGHLILATALGATALAGEEARARAIPGPPIAQPGPRLVFAESLFDFGRINAGDVVRHGFVFTNAGDRLLEIERVVPGCGCTSVSAGEQRVAPGQSGVIPVEFNSRGINGATLRSISVFANDPTQRHTVLKIMADVWTPVELQPSLAVFHHEVEFPRSETKLLRVLNHLEEPVAVALVGWTNRSFEVGLKTVRPGREFALEITSVPPLSTGVVTLPLLLTTSASQVPLLKASICAVEQPPLALTPPQLPLPPGPLAKPERRVVMIHNRGRAPLTLSELEIDLAGVQGRVHELQRGRVFSIALTFPAGFEAPDQPAAELRLRSDHPRYPFIRVPLVGPGPAGASPGPVRKPGDVAARARAAVP